MNRLPVEPSGTMLGSLESEVMASLTAVQEASARDVRKQLEHRGIVVAYTTVATILGRLYDKRLVRRRRESCRGGSRYVYRSVDFERKYLRTLLQGVVTLFGPSGVVHLNEELAKLRPESRRRLPRKLNL
jgi:predicted transcriptional regulator